MAYNIVVPDSVKAAIQRLSNRDVKYINERLSADPYDGAPLSGALTGMYGIKTPGNRYQIVYSIQNKTVNILKVLPSST